MPSDRHASGRAPGAASGGLVCTQAISPEYTPIPYAAPTRDPGKTALAAEIAALDDAALGEQVLVLATAPAPSCRYWPRGCAWPPRSSPSAGASAWRGGLPHE